MSKVIDLTGQRFGSLVVIKREGTKNGYACWLCQCDCGKTRIYTSKALRTDRAKSCGCSNAPDLTGKTFGRLTVLNFAYSKNGMRYWHCQCSCGKTVDVATKSLNSGNTQSCGCLHSETIRNFNIKNKSKIDQSTIIGQKFDFLEVLDIAEPINGLSAYLCYCHNCGNTKIIKYSDLVSGRIHACGCLLSWGEAKIKQLLADYNISYKTQYIFDNLVSKKNYPLRFDFAIFNSQGILNCLIEYQGQQHYNKDNNYWTPQLEEHDKLKSEYCKQHNIPLYYIDKNTNLEEFIKQLAEGVV